MNSSTLCSFEPDALELTVTGATIIVHGFEPTDGEGDRLLPLAQAIRDRADPHDPLDPNPPTGTAWLLDYDQAGGGFDREDSDLPLVEDQGLSGEVVLLFDWSADSRQLSPGWAEAAGEVLFGMLFELGLFLNLHFIGHGSGAAVISEVVERFSVFNLPIDHVTYLDPHDFNQGLVFDGAQRLDDLAQPAGYGAAVWDHVGFADVYYQTRGANGSEVSDRLVPKGRPIPGAYNYLLDDTNFLPDPDTYKATDVFGDHDFVWNGFYLDTVVPNLQNVNITQLEGSHSEVPIAVNPTNPQNLIAAPMDFPHVFGPPSVPSVWVSMDGGATWDQTEIPLPTGVTATHGDPAIVFNRQGRALYLHMLDTGPDPNDHCDGDPNNRECHHVGAAVSHDGGLTWDSDDAVAVTIPDMSEDKPFLAVGPDFNNPNQDRFVATWTRDAPDGPIFASPSVDGLTWEPGAQVQVSDSTSGNIDAVPALGPGGEVYVVWEDLSVAQQGRLMFDRSFDGGSTWGTDVNVFTSTLNGLDDIDGNLYTIPAHPRRGIWMGLSIDVDRTEGPNRGRIYVAFADSAGVDPQEDHDNTDIFVMTSDDHGATWTSPLRVNDDGGNASQFFSWLAVDQTTGDVGITWYDARNSGAANNSVEYFGAVSTNGANSFSSNFQISQGISRADFNFNPFEYGDYTGLAFHRGVLHPAWPDNSNSTNDNPDFPNLLPNRETDTYTAQVATTGYGFSRISQNTVIRPQPVFYENPDRSDWQAGLLYNEFDRVRHDGQDYVARRTHTSRDAAGQGFFAPEPEPNEPPNQVFWEPVDGPFLPQDHTFTGADLVDPVFNTPNMQGLLKQRLTPDDITGARWKPQRHPLDLVNGDFDDVGDAVASKQRQVPGWSFHAGVHAADAQDLNIDTTARHLVLDEVGPAVTHNFFRVPVEAERLVLDLKVVGFSANDQFQIRLDNTVLQEVGPPDDHVDLTGPTADFAEHRFFIPVEDRAEVRTLTIELLPADDEDEVNAEVLIDDVRLDGHGYLVKAGDVSVIDLESVAGGTGFNITQLPDPALGRVIEADDFDTLGLLFFVPTITSNGLGIDLRDRVTIGFEVDIGGVQEKQMTFAVVDDYSTSGPDSIVLSGSVGASADDDPLDVYQVQQRLRYLNFRDENGDAVEVNGVDSANTRQAIRLFQAATQEDGSGNPSQPTGIVDGRVDVGFRSNRWLNSPNAPFWAELREALRNRIDIGQEVSASSPTLLTIESAVFTRPELNRIGQFEEFGANSLTEYPDVGPIVHVSHTYKAGVTIGWELEQEALAAPGGTGNLPIVFTDPFDLGQEAITDAERAVIEDILAFVFAEGGREVKGVRVGGTGGAPSYPRIRDVLTHLGVPNVDNSSGHDDHFRIDLIPPQGDTSIIQAVQDAIL